MALTFESLGKMGRLGNQMFQYAALRGISENLGYDYYCQTQEIELFNVFEITPKIGFGNSEKVTHQGFEFDSNLYNNCSDNTDLYGYFQSEKYFKSIEHIIRKEYRFKNKIYNLCNHYIKSTYPQQELISLHIRRGDYLVDKNFVNLPLEYYYESIEKLPNLKILVFSDDCEWCKKNFSDKKFSIINTKSTEIDLCLMTLCNYHIIANSSFSWWGAWLSKSKKTIAPSKWFQNEYSSWNTKDLYLQNWIII